MSRDRNDQTESAGPNWPDRIGSDRNSSDRNSSDRIGQTESARPKLPDRKVLFRLETALFVVHDVTVVREIGMNKTIAF